MINRDEKNFLKEITLRKKVSKFINKNEKHIQKNLIIIYGGIQKIKRCY